MQHNKFLWSRKLWTLRGKKTSAIDHEATEKLRQEAPLGQFNGLGTYFNRSHLAVEEVGVAWDMAESFGDFWDQIQDLPLYRALAFTLTYTVVVTPLVIIFGLFIAVGVNNLPKLSKGRQFLCPCCLFWSRHWLIINSVWIVDSDGILGAIIQAIFNDPNLSLKASTTLTWIMLIVYGIWHTLPFSFITFYAGLQTSPQKHWRPQK